MTINLEYLRQKLPWKRSRGGTHSFYTWKAKKDPQLDPILYALLTQNQQELNDWGRPGGFECDFLKVKCVLLKNGQDHYRKDQPFIDKQNFPVIIKVDSYGDSRILQNESETVSLHDGASQSIKPTLNTTEGVLHIPKENEAHNPTIIIFTEFAYKRLKR